MSKSTALPALVNGELQFPQLLKDYQFYFRTPSESTQLASYIVSLAPENASYPLELAINEIFFNAIEHGNLGITYEKKYFLKEHDEWEDTFKKLLNSPLHRHKRVKVNLQLSPFYLVLEVEDEGIGFNWQEFTKKKCASSHPLHGRGLMIAKSVFDNIEFLGKGNKVRCEFALKPYVRYAFSRSSFHFHPSSDLIKYRVVPRHLNFPSNFD